MRFIDPAKSGALIAEELPQPKPQGGQVLVRVYAAGVTPSEVGWYPTTQTKSGGLRSGAVPSHEFSGVIAGFGEEVDGLEEGQPVYGMNDWFADGALAEYCISEPDWIAPKPRSLDHNQSASVPIGALTAWQGLFDRAKLQAGQRVLVHGGAGAVGVFAIQLASSRGAHVITTVSADDFDFVRALGAHEVIDYRSEAFEGHVRDVDVVFDTVGGDTLRRSWGVLKPGGRLVTIAAGGKAATDERTKLAFFIVEPSRSQLLAIANMLDEGKLRRGLGCLYRGREKDWAGKAGNCYRVRTPMSAIQCIIRSPASRNTSRIASELRNILRKRLSPM